MKHFEDWLKILEDTMHCSTEADYSEDDENQMVVTLYPFDGSDQMTVMLNLDEEENVKSYIITFDTEDFCEEWEGKSLKSFKENLKKAVEKELG